jgi:hypothetical protein
VCGENLKFSGEKLKFAGEKKSIHHFLIQKFILDPIVVDPYQKEHTLNKRTQLQSIMMPKDTSRTCSNNNDSNNNAKALLTADPAIIQAGDHDVFFFFSPLFSLFLSFPPVN